MSPEGAGDLQHRRRLQLGSTRLWREVLELLERGLVLDGRAKRADLTTEGWLGVIAWGCLRAFDLAERSGTVGVRYGAIKTEEKTGVEV